MQHITDTLPTSDGLKLQTYMWLPSESDDLIPPKAILIIVHGLSEHAGRFQHVAEHLVPLGYGVVALDHRGHGKSEGLQGYFESFDDPVNDLGLFVDRIKARYPDTKLFMWGHSMGSLISLLFTLRRQDDLTGLLVSGVPLTVEDNSPAALVAIGRQLNRIAPKMRFVKLNAAHISHDPAVVAAYRNDPLVDNRLKRLNTVNGILTGSRYVREHARHLQLPLLIFHGEADKICPPSGSRVLMDSASSPDKTIQIYPGFYHEPHNEVDKQTVLENMTAWLDAHSDNSAG